MCQVRDQEKLLEMIFTSLSDNPEVLLPPPPPPLPPLFLIKLVAFGSPQLVEGVGQLIFEVCKGVPKQFHSCTEKVYVHSITSLF